MLRLRFSRRGVIASALAVAAGMHGRLAAGAADRPARIVVGSAPGGGTDTVARLMAEALAGVGYAPSVIVENRPGASSRLAIEAVKAAAPDGTTILLVPMPALTLSPHVFPRTTRFDPVADFTPAATVGEVVYGLVVRADHPARDLGGFLDRARVRGKTTFAPPVLGAPQHMLGLGLARSAGIELTVVPYRTGSQAQTDLLGGRLDSFMSHMAELSGNLRGGRTRLLAVSAPERLPTWPKAPTFAEAGFPELTAGEAFCLVLPVGTPGPSTTALHRAVDGAIARPEVRERLARLEIAPRVLDPAATGARIGAEFAAWGAVVRASGFTAEE